jgi:hypothetical protein
VRKPSGEVYQTTALIAAALHGRLEAARLLLDAGADPSRVDSDGVTPLMGAAANGQLEVLRLLLARGGTVDAARPDGCTAFHCACAHDQPECAEALARAGCDVRVKTKNGRTGWKIAEVRGHAALVARLDALGAARPAGGAVEAPAAAAADSEGGAAAAVPCSGCAVALNVPRSGPPRGGEAPLAFSYENPFCVGVLYGRTERLTAQNGDFRPGQGSHAVSLPGVRCS